MILAYLIPVALLVGLIRGGSLRHYVKRPLRAVWLPCAAFLLEAVLGKLPEWTGLSVPVCLAAAVGAQYALLALFCLLNFARRGMKAMSLGVLFNAAVIFANGFRMPVSEMARRLPDLSETAARIDAGILMEYVITAPSAPLYFLGDVVYLPFLPGGLASVGDFLLGIGLFLLLLGVMKRPEA